MVINDVLEDCTAVEISVKINHVFSSLRVMKYLSLMKYIEFVLGNSSSGIIEAPALEVPTVVRNLYGDGHTAEKIRKKIVEVVKKETVDLKKNFYNINSRGKIE